MTLAYDGCVYVNASVSAVHLMDTVCVKHCGVWCEVECCLRENSMDVLGSRVLLHGVLKPLNCICTSS